MFKLFSKFKKKRKKDFISIAREQGVLVGEDCRIYSLNFGSEPYLVSLGKHVTVSHDVSFVTHDGGVWVLREEYPEIDIIKPIIVHDNSFIGAGSIILPGVEIGPNSIIGAGSVVNKTVPPNSVYAGVPAKFIKALEDYKTEVLSKAFPTKNLTQEEKKTWLMNFYGDNPISWKKKLESD